MVSCRPLWCLIGRRIAALQLFAWLFGPRQRILFACSGKAECVDRSAAALSVLWRRACRGARFDLGLEWCAGRPPTNTSVGASFEHVCVCQSSGLNGCILVGASVLHKVCWCLSLLHQCFGRSSAATVVQAALQCTRTSGGEMSPGQGSLVFPRHCEQL